MTSFNPTQGNPGKGLHRPSPLQLKPLLAATVIVALWSGTAASAPTPAEILAEQERVEASKTVMLRPGQMIKGTDFERAQRPFTIQRLTKRAYWIEVAAYESTVLVGDEGVLVIDAPCCGRVPTYIEAIREITDLPISTLVYSHYHLDHVSGVNDYVAHAKSAKLPLRIIGTTTTKAQIEKFGKKIPMPTEVVSVPRGTFDFEGMTVLMGTPPSGHTPDNSWILVESERILHSVDLVHPGFLEFMDFGIAEDLDGYEKSVRELLTLEWDFLCAGHSNVGSQIDVQAVLDYMTDMRKHTREAMNETEFGPFVQDGKIFYEWIAEFRDAIVDKTVDSMRPKWASYPGFDVVVRSHAERMFFETYLH